MCRCEFTLRQETQNTKKAILISDVAYEGSVCGGAPGTWEVSVPLSECSCKPNTPLRNKVFKKLK